MKLNLKFLTWSKTTILFSLMAAFVLFAGSNTILQAQENEPEAVEVVQEPAAQQADFLIYLPTIYKPFAKLDLQHTRPNSANDWQLFWDDAGTGLTYEVEESQTPTFDNSTVINAGSDSFVDINTHDPSPNNLYYYRARVKDGSNLGPWSDVIAIATAYEDHFDDPNTGWNPVRRTTFLEETNSYYGSGSEAGNLIVVVGDRWDWLVASPLRPAPELPYAIEYSTRVHDPGNLISGGPVYGGDWNGQACPEIGNVYRTTNCFNHFYNYNFIWYGPIKLLHEQVDELLWCPDCGGSPIKRLGPTKEVNKSDGLVKNGSANDYHNYRIEVRSDGSKLYIDNDFISEFDDTTWANDPYFGVFASTDEYKPSIWFYDYYKVTPLD